MNREMHFIDYVEMIDEHFIIIQVVLGIVSILYVLTLKLFRRNRSGSQASFASVVILVLIGTVFTFLGAYELRIDLNTGHVFMGGIYHGWQRVWIPMVISVVSVLFLISIEIFHSRLKLKQNKISGKIS